MASHSGTPQNSFDDIVQAAAAWRLWHVLAQLDVKRQYGKSRFWMAWIVGFTAIYVAVLTFIFSRLNNAEPVEFAFYVGTGFVTWQFISEILNEGARLFQQSEGLIKNSILPRCIFAFRIVTKHTFRLLINLSMIASLYLIFWVAPPASLLLLPISLAALIVIGLASLLLVGLLSLYLPDFGALVTLTTRIMFFATPIMWKPESLGGHAYIAEYNPFYHFIEMIRAPMLGTLPTTTNTMVVLVLGALICVSAYALYALWFKRIVFWL